MSARSQPRTLPIRRWLALALLATFFVPVCVTIAFAIASVRGEPRDEQAEAVDRLRADVARWNDPAWQTTTRSQLAHDDIAFILVEGGRELYRSEADPFAGADGNQNPRIIERAVIANSEPQKVAYVYADQDLGPPDEIPVELFPIVAVTALGLTLAGIAWFLGRTVLRPLAATGQAAKLVAEGDLNVTLPRSRVREVAEVNDAFESMSAALRASLREQVELEQDRRLFIGAVAHDLRTPLFALRGYLEGIESGVASTPEQRARYVSIAREKADALERLISDLFDFTRLEYLDQTPIREPLDLTAMLSKLVVDIQPQANATGITITFVEGTGPCSISGDSHLLTRAIENLLDNALRFTPTGGSVEVVCSTTPDGVTFSVADSGPGIALADLPHLFNPLYRGESSRNRRTGGAGLGLTIAQRILLAHGGDLTAANRPEGGAVFTSRLPFAG